VFARMNSLGKREPVKNNFFSMQKKVSILYRE